MQPDIDLLGLSLKTFGLCFGLAFVVSGAIVARRLKELGHPPDWAYEMVFAALIGGLVGARLYWILGNLDEVRGDVLGGVFGGSGLVWYGGGLGGAAGVLLWARRRGMFNLELLDLCSPALAMGYAVGRDRLSDLRRRRLRQPDRPALGHGLPQRRRADDGGRPPDADLRDPLDGAHRVGAVEGAPRAAPRRGLRLVSPAGGHGALAGGVRAPQRAGRRRVDRGAAAEPRDDDRGRRVAVAGGALGWVAARCRPLRGGRQPRRRRPAPVVFGGGARLEEQRHWAHGSSLPLSRERRHFPWGRERSGRHARLTRRIRRTRRSRARSDRRAEQRHAGSRDLQRRRRTAARLHGARPDARAHDDRPRHDRRDTARQPDEGGAHARRSWPGDRGPRDAPRVSGHDAHGSRGCRRVAHRTHRGGVSQRQPARPRRRRGDLPVEARQRRPLGTDAAARRARRAATARRTRIRCDPNGRHPHTALTGISDRCPRRRGRPPAARRLRRRRARTRVRHPLVRRRRGRPARAGADVRRGVPRAHEELRRPVRLQGIPVHCGLPRAGTRGDLLRRGVRGRARARAARRL